MKFNQKVSNAMLCGAIETMKADPNDKTRRMVLEEILKATFLCPVTLSQPPVTGKDGEPAIPEGCQVQYQMLQDSKDRPLLMAFTGEEQMQRWKEKSGHSESYAFGCNFQEYAMMMLNKQEDGSFGPAQGFVIDPYGENLVMDRDKVINIMIRTKEVVIK